ncbi:MAG: hypothetical protein WC384_17670 [Prolixibacteraceae bacterium]|jgi:tetratricopeptide (TPR) repeat protein
MNWLTKPAILFFGIINFLFAQSAFCQSLDEIVSFSDQQYEKGNYELAANEYNRALFFGYSEQDILCMKIANCYFNQNKLDQSAIFYDRAYFSSSSDSLKTEAILGKSFSLILEKNFILALSELMNIDSSNVADQNIRLNFMKGIAYFGLNEDDLARDAFNKCAAEFPGKNNARDFEKEFADIRKSEKRFNPQTAWFMSLIVPGSGQLYSGAYKDAANSAVLLGGLIYLTVSFAAKYTFLEAVVLVLPWFQRYYMGGANKAERLTLEKQLRKRNDSYQAIMRRLESESQQNFAN